MLKIIKENYRIISKSSFKFILIIFILQLLNLPFMIAMGFDAPGTKWYEVAKGLILFYGQNLLVGFAIAFIYNSIKIYLKNKKTKSRL